MKKVTNEEAIKIHREMGWDKRYSNGVHYKASDEEILESEEKHGVAHQLVNREEILKDQHANQITRRD